VGSLWGLAVLWLLLDSRLAAGLESWAQRHSQRRWLQGLLFFAVLLVVYTLANLPLDVFGHHVSRDYEISVQGWPSWLLDQAKALGLSVLLGAPLLLLFHWIVRRWPRRYWIAAWVVSLPLLVLSVFAEPLIEPIFNTYGSVLIWILVCIVVALGAAYVKTWRVQIDSIWRFHNAAKPQSVGRAKLRFPSPSKGVFVFNLPVSAKGPKSRYYFGHLAQNRHSVCSRFERDIHPIFVVWGKNLSLLDDSLVRKICRNLLQERLPVGDTDRAAPILLTCDLGWGVPYDSDLPHNTRNSAGSYDLAREGFFRLPSDANQNPRSVGVHLRLRLQSNSPQGKDGSDNPKQPNEKQTYIWGVFRTKETLEVALRYTFGPLALYGGAFLLYFTCDYPRRWWRWIGSVMAIGLIAIGLGALLLPRYWQDDCEEYHECQSFQHNSAIVPQKSLDSNDFLGYIKYIRS